MYLEYLGLVMDYVLYDLHNRNFDCKYHEFNVKFIGMVKYNFGGII